MSLVTPRGVFTVSPDRDPDLFWATAGGMGLTGVIVSAVLRLIPIETSWMQVDSQRFSRLDALMSDDGEWGLSGTATASHGWTACKAALGNQRSILTRGDHAPFDALPNRLRNRQREVPGDPSLRVPLTGHGRLLNRLSIRALNEAWFRTSRDSESSLQSMAGYFHPLDGFGAWNLLYGRRGFVQYQFAVPSKRADVVQTAVASGRGIGAACLSRRVETLRPRDSRSTLLRSRRLDSGSRFPTRSAFPPGIARSSR